MPRPESVPVVVVGAGPAGLATAACLARQGVEYLLLEKSSRVGSAWHDHYDRLHLHTHRSASELPGMPFPRTVGRYPSRQQVIDYLEAYARRFEIQPRFGAEVGSVARRDGGWEVEAGGSRVDSSCVVVATGFTRVPYRPSWPGLESFPGRVIHSAEYKNGEPYRGQRVLVVGFGNSAGEIAICLHEHGARPGLAIRGRVNVIPRDLLGLPILGVGSLLAWLPSGVADALSYPLLAPTRRRAHRAGLRLRRDGVFAQIRRQQRVPLLDIGTLDLMGRGAITCHHGIERFDGDEILFEDGRRERFDALVLATGYRPRVDQFVGAAPEALDAAGAPRSSGQPVPGAPGLFFTGFRVAPSGMLREISREARAVAAAVAERVNGASGAMS